MRKVAISIWKNWTHDQYRLLLTDCYFSRIITLNTQQHLKDYLLIISQYFKFFTWFFFFFLWPLFKLSCTRKHHAYNLYRILHTLSFCFLIYYIVSEICIGGSFLEYWFYCHSKQIISDVANVSQMYNLTKRAPETLKI